MARVHLVHWKHEELAERAKVLRSAGHRVTSSAEQGVAGARNIAARPPDAVVIDLGRLPSHGVHLAAWLRQRPATRRVPIVFVDGKPEALERARTQLPDAGYASWRGIRGALQRALRAPARDPVVPSRPDYSGTPLPSKLGIKPDSVLALLAAPRGFDKTLGELPPDVTVRRQARGHCNVIVLFIESCADLKRRFPAAARSLATGGGLWLAYPKKSSGRDTDVTQDFVRNYVLQRGLVDNKICAIDEVWSGLRFMRRTKSKKAAARR